MTFPSLAVLALLILSLIWPECQEFEPMVDLAWWGMTYDLWMAYDVKIGLLPDEIVTYFAMSIEIDLAWWELACHEQLCLMRSSFTLLWDDYLWDYYWAFGVWFNTQFQRVDVVISDRHRSSVSIIWGFKSLMFETVVACGWPSFQLAHTLLPLLISRPLLALWASHGHHSIFFLIALLTFYTGVRALRYIYALFGSLMSHELIDSSFSLFFFVVLPSFFIILIYIYPLFYPLILSSHFFLCHEWWSFTFQCMENDHIPLPSYLMDISSEILSWESHLVKESLPTSLFESISISLCILRWAHLLIFRVCASKKNEMKKKKRKKEKKGNKSMHLCMYTMSFFVECIYWSVRLASLS